MFERFDFCWPDSNCSTAHMIYAYNEAIEGLRLALGPCPILLSLVQGLFHPARKVREAYWKLYNSAYIATQDSMVPFYPVMDGSCKSELSYIL